MATLRNTIMSSELDVKPSNICGLLFVVLLAVISATWKVIRVHSVELAVVDI